MDKNKITKIIEDTQNQLEFIANKSIETISKSLICTSDTSGYDTLPSDERIKEEVGKEVSTRVKLNRYRLNGDFIDYGNKTQIIEGSVYVIHEPAFLFDKLNHIHDALNSIHECLDADH